MLVNPNCIDSYAMKDFYYEFGVPFPRRGSVQDLGGGTGGLLRRSGASP